VKVAGDTPEQMGTFPVNLAGGGEGHLSADGKRVAAVLGRRVAVFELQSGELLWSWTPPAHLGGVHGVALSADGGHLATGNGDGTVHVVQLPRTP
jgi:WD40 repeat protein